MKDEDKTKGKHISELVELRQRITELEASEIERKLAEDALRSAYQKQRAIFDAIQENMNVLDLEFNLTDVNETLIKNFRLPDKDLVLGHKCFEIMKGRKDICPNCAVAEAYRTKAPAYRTSTPEDEVSTKGRSFEIFVYPIMDEHGNLTGAVEFARDITERKRAEEALRKAHYELERRVEERTAELIKANEQLKREIEERKQTEKALEESEHRYRCVFENTGAATIIIEEDSILSMCNAEFENLTGYSKDEVEGKMSWTEFATREDVERMKEYHAKRREGGGGGEAPTEYEFKLFDKHGNMKDVFVKVGMIPRSKRSIASLIDITERKLADEEKKKLEAQLQHAQRNEAIGSLAGGIAHDFNNLLMAIQGNVSLMLYDIDSTHPNYEYLKNIEKQVQSGAKLSKQLLGYARKGRYEVKPINLNQLVEEASDTFGSAKKEIIIHRELAEDLFVIEADEGQLGQVLLNLLVNAGDAMPNGGDLFLKTINTTHEDMKGKLNDPKPGDYVLLAVTDTGLGMDKKIVERIFEPFFTTKEMGRGTGLGLASVYGIIKAHGGYIDVDSEKGHGTTFSIYLPASEKKVQKTVESVQRITETSGTILLIDDEAMVLDVGVKVLKKLGYTVLEAKSGREAVEVYKENKDQIDMVILDMIMPDMGGGEAYDRMKELNPHVKVLLSSGYSMDGQATEILKRGCDAFIQKPFSMKELSKKTKEILDKKKS